MTNLDKNPNGVSPTSDGKKSVTPAPYTATHFWWIWNILIGLSIFSVIQYKDGVIGVPFFGMIAAAAVVVYMTLQNRKTQ